MSYCVPRWIAPHDYKAIADNKLAPKSTAALAQTAMGAAPIDGSFWLVAGVVEDGAAAMRPLLQFDTMGFDTLGEGSHRIEIRDAGAGPTPATPVTATPEVGFNSDGKTSSATRGNLQHHELLRTQVDRAS